MYKMPMFGKVTGLEGSPSPKDASLTTPIMAKREDGEECLAGHPEGVMSRLEGMEKEMARLHGLVIDLLEFKEGMTQRLNEKDEIIKQLKAELERVQEKKILVEEKKEEVRVRLEEDREVTTVEKENLHTEVGEKKRSFVDLFKQKGMTWKEAKKVTRSVTPPAKIVGIKFQYFKSKAHATRSEAIKFVFTKVLVLAGIRNMVKEISFMGRQILILYVEEKDTQKVKEGMRKIARGENTVISEKEFQEFNKSKLSKEEGVERAIQRIAFLYARNEAFNLRECLLKELPVEKHEIMKEKAKQMKEKWDQLAKEKEEEKADGMDES